MNATASTSQLAVVIPAFKPDFLAKVLKCLLQQTDQRFGLYICDDASPADIATIARSVLGARPYTFTRFENNLGGASLAKHWDRCVALTHEPWVWLFSDDDLMDDNCVKEFYQFLGTAGDSADIVRFDGWMVNEQDRIIGTQPFNSDRETWLEFAYGHLLGCRRSLFTQQLVFRRSAFEQAGGFLDLPLCWGTEYATVIAMSRQRGMRRLPGARVLWRSSRQNLSPDRSLRVRSAKLRACCLFLQWLDGQFQEPREHLFEGDEATFRNAMDLFLVPQIMNEGCLPALANWKLLAQTRVNVCQGSRFSLLKHIALAAVNDSLAMLGSATRTFAGNSKASHLFS